MITSVHPSPALADGTDMPGRRRFGLHVRLAAVLAVLSLTIAGCGGDGGDGAGNGESQPFYEGKTVELIVPFDTGGGTDTIARFLAELLSDHVEGSPTVQVVNVPGAGTLIGHNEFAGRENDGLTWFLGGASGTFLHLFDSPDAQFDYADWEPILGVAQGAVIYVSPETGVTEFDDLTTASGLIFGASNPEGADLARVFTLDFLGVPFTPIWGYDGSGPARIAFEQGESNLNADTTTAYIENIQPMIEAGDAIPLFSQGQMDGDQLVRDPAVPDLPHAGEVYEEIHGSPAQGEILDAYTLLVRAGSTLNKIMFLKADAPNGANEAVREGVQAMLEDPRYADGVEEFLGGYDISTGASFDETVQEVLSPDPATVEFIKRFAVENYGAHMAE